MITLTVNNNINLTVIIVKANSPPPETGSWWTGRTGLSPDRDRFRLWRRNRREVVSVGRRLGRTRNRNLNRIATRRLGVSRRRSKWLGVWAGPRWRGIGSAFGIGLGFRPIRLRSKCRSEMSENTFYQVLGFQWNKKVFVKISYSL